MNLFILTFICYTFLSSLIVVISILIAVAYYTLLDRKVMRAMQRRQGPNIVGFSRILQPLADGLKLFVKEMILPTHSNTNLFILAPIFTFIMSMLPWVVVPFSSLGPIVNIDTRLLFILTSSSLRVLGILLAGWSSNSKYAFLGGLRSSAQMISYEVSLGFILLAIVIVTRTTNLYEIVIHQSFYGIFSWHCWFLWPQLVLFIISALAETNRVPFDLPEAEAELVAGYFVDFSALTFALFFLAEYSSMLVMATLINLLFFRGWLSPFINDGNFTTLWLGVKNTTLCFFWVHVRATFPRYRFDQLMALGWKTFLPLSVSLLIATSSFLYLGNGFVYTL